MPVSVMKFLTIRSDTEYRMICFAYGGSEKFFAEKGLSTPVGHIAGVIIGPNPSLLTDTVFGSGKYGVERAGFVGNVDLMAAWRYILRHFDKLPERCVMTVEQSADIEFGWSVKTVEEDLT